LQNKYKLPVVDLKRNLLNLLQSEKEKRRLDRYFLRGFKAIEKEEGNDNAEVVDAELDNEDETFNREEHEIAMTKKVF